MQRLLLSLGSFIVAILMVEGALRIVDPLAPKKGQAATEKVERKKNSLGLRGSTEYPLEHETFRILALGDSFTYGLRLQESGSWPRQVEGLLTERYEGVEVLNGGRPGTNTKQQLGLFDKFLSKYNPDLVIIGFLLNDCTKLCSNCGPVTMATKLERVVNRPAGFSRFSYVARLWEVSTLERKLTEDTVNMYKIPYEQELDTYHECIDAFRTFKNRADAGQFKLAVVQYPMLFGLEKGYPFAAEHLKVRTALAELGIPAFDLTPAFAGQKDRELWVHPRNSHPNRAANAIAARAIADYLSQFIPVERSRPR